MDEKKTDLSRWVKISKADGLPISKSLLYKWHHRREHMQIFSKLGGGVFVDTDGLFELIESGRPEPC